ncbi:MAG: mannose-1-phosphate guanylyltransferase/mannose-6-phosphate isomerase [Acidobacteria bacterium]|nr:MAG: mannose-1-phosphate guanylyltransferase/mannose-6-phosphate isomerase [Acidobacteriota bacterium]
MGAKFWAMILAGGKGERFWPLSREKRPKPLLDLGSGRSLLWETLRRARRVVGASRIRVVAGGHLAGAIRGEMGRVGRAAVLVEPAPRNTGPAALLASRWVWERDPDGTVLLLPSDHRVVGDDAFRRAVEGARRLSEKGFLVTFGVRPAGPAPDYGYIVRGERIGLASHRVARFVEKPLPSTARSLIGRHRALWNSGMFVWRADCFLEEAARCEPAFRRWLRACDKGGSAGTLARRAFTRLPSTPVDRAVLERSDRVAVVEARFKWSDLGTWSALYDMGRRDRAGNVGWGRWVCVSSRGNLTFSPDGLTVLFGVSNFLVARVGEVVLVCPRPEAASLRDLLAELRRRGLGGYL